MPKVPRKLTDVSDKRIPDGCVHEYRCTVCMHPERNDVDSMLIDGTHTLKDIAEEYGLSVRALFSHKTLHLSAAMLAAASDSAIVNTQAILGRMQRRAIKLDASYERTGIPGSAKIALEHDQSVLKATGNWRESHGLDIRGAMQLSPGEQKEADLLEWLAVEYPDIHTRYLQHCEAKLLTTLDTIPIDPTTDLQNATE
jgi:hypothetical protein